jgi:flagellar biosynthesis/type III secretory pathway protein FliH
MAEEKKDVNTGEEEELTGAELLQTEFEDNVTDDHHAGIGSSADDNESHQLDIDDYDEVIENADKHAEGEASGETETTDDPAKDAEGESTEGDEAKIPKERLDEVILERNTEREERATDKAEWAKKEAYFEGRLQALESGKQTTEEVAEVVSPFDQILEGEPQQIIDALQANPAEFFTNLRESAEAKAAKSITAANEEKQYYDNLRTGLDKFGADHEGFMDNIEQMHGVMGKNPIHNLVSAFAYEIEIPALKSAHEKALATATGDLEAAKAEGVKIGKAEALKDFQSKGAAATLDGSQSVEGAKVTPQPELEDTEKSGGIRAILTKNLLTRRAGKG